MSAEVAVPIAATVASVDEQKTEDLIAVDKMAMAADGKKETMTEGLVDGGGGAVINNGPDKGLEECGSAGGAAVPTAGLVTVNANANANANAVEGSAKGAVVNANNDGVNANANANANTNAVAVNNNKADPPAPKCNVHKTNFEKDVIYLYQFSRTPLLPSLSPYCLKVETWLRLAGLKYEVGLSIHYSLLFIPHFYFYWKIFPFNISSN